MLKRYLKMVVKFLIAIFVGFLILMLGIFLSTYISYLYDYYFNVVEGFKEVYNIEIKEPDKVQKIFNTGGIDPDDLRKFAYSEDAFLEALKYDYGLAMDKDKVEKILENNVYKYLNDKNEEKIRTISEDIMENEENYYAHFFKKGSYEILFLYDVDENVIYSLNMDL